MLCDAIALVTRCSRYSVATTCECQTAAATAAAAVVVVVIIHSYAVKPFCCRLQLCELRFSAHVGGGCCGQLCIAAIADLLRWLGPSGTSSMSTTPDPNLLSIHVPCVRTRVRASERACMMRMRMRACAHACECVGACVHA